MFVSPGCHVDCGYKMQQLLYKVFNHQVLVLKKMNSQLLPIFPQFSLSFGLCQLHTGVSGLFTILLVYHQLPINLSMMGGQGLRSDLMVSVSALLFRVVMMKDLSKL